MRLIGQKADALAVLQLYKFTDERLLTSASLNYRLRPEAVFRPLTPTSINSPVHASTYLEPGQSENGVVYFEQSDSWGG